MSDNGLKNKWIEYTILAIITLLAGGLRFHNLDVWSYWIDEYFSLESSLKPYLENLHQPFWLITKASLDLFGVNAIALRFPPFLFGVMSIALLYFPFKVIFDKRVALLASFFLAISPWHIYLSQLARWYSLLLLVSTYALFTFYLYIERSSVRYLLLSVFLFLFAFALHLTAGFIIMIGIVYLLILSRSPKLQPAGFNSRTINIILLAIIGCSVLLIPKFTNFVIEWNQIQLRDGYWGTTPANITQKILYHMTPSMGFAALLGIVLLLAQRERKGIFIAIFALLPLALLNCAALLKTNISVKYAFFTLPALIAAASFMCVFIFDQLKKHRVIIAVALIGIFAIPSLYTDFLYFTSGYGNRDRLTEAMQYIQKRWLPDDRILPIYFFTNPDYARIYLETTSRLNNFGLDAEHILFPETPEKIDRTKRIWVMTIGHAISPYSTGFYEWVSLNTNMVAELKANKGPKDNSVRIFLHQPTAGEIGLEDYSSDFMEPLFQANGVLR